MNADGTGQRNLTRNPARDVARVWLPVGRKIAFDSDRSGRARRWPDETYTMNIDGSALRKWGRGHSGLVAQRTEDRLGQRPRRRSATRRSTS